jgi:hypothetical protein
MAGQIAEDTRGEDAARLRRRLKTCRDVHTVTGYVLTLDDHIACMKAGAQGGRLRRMVGSVGSTQFALNTDRTLKRLSSRREFD